MNIFIQLISGDFVIILLILSFPLPMTKVVHHIPPDNYLHEIFQTIFVRHGIYTCQVLFLTPIIWKHIINISVPEKQENLIVFH